MDLTIKFSMDRIKNMDQLYTWTPTYSEELGCPGEEEHYHGPTIANRLLLIVCYYELGDAEISWFVGSHCKRSV